MPSPVNAAVYLPSPAGSLAGSPQTLGANFGRGRGTPGSSRLSRGNMGDGDGFVHARMDEATQATAQLALEIVTQVPCLGGTTGREKKGRSG